MVMPDSSRALKFPPHFLVLTRDAGLLLLREEIGSFRKIRNFHFQRCEKQKRRWIAKIFDELPIAGSFAYGGK